MVRKRWYLVSIWYICIYTCYTCLITGYLRIISEIGFGSINYCIICSDFFNFALFISIIRSRHFISIVFDRIICFNWNRNRISCRSCVGITHWCCRSSICTRVSRYNWRSVNLRRSRILIANSRTSIWCSYLSVLLSLRHRYRRNWCHSSWNCSCCRWSWILSGYYWSLIRRSCVCRRHNWNISLNYWRSVCGDWRRGIWVLVGSSRVCWGSICIQSWFLIVDTWSLIWIRILLLILFLLRYLLLLSRLLFPFSFSCLSNCISSTLIRYSTFLDSAICWNKLYFTSIITCITIHASCISRFRSIDIWIRWRSPSRLFFFFLDLRGRIRRNNVIIFFVSWFCYFCWSYLRILNEFDLTVIWLSSWFSWNVSRLLILLVNLLLFLLNWCLL